MDPLVGRPASRLLHAGDRAGRVIGRGGSTLRALRRYLGVGTTVQVEGRGAAAQVRLEAANEQQLATAEVEVRKLLTGRRFELALWVTPVLLEAGPAGPATATARVLPSRRLPPAAPLSDAAAGLAPLGIVAVREWYDGPV